MATTVVATTPVSEWKEKLDMTPPKKTVGGMKVDANLADVEQSIRDDGMEEYLVQQGVPATDEQKIVHFRLGQVVHAHFERCVRILTVGESENGSLTCLVNRALQRSAFRMRKRSRRSLNRLHLLRLNTARKHRENVLAAQRRR